MEFKIAPNFIASSEMMELSDQASFGEMIENVKRQKVSGFILKVNNVPTYYVKGVVLAGKLEDIYKKNIPTQKKLNDFITEIPDAYLRIMQVPLSIKNASSLKTPGHSVYQVSGGWFLNHESLVETRTQRFIVYCTNEKDGGPHENYSTISVDCVECGAPLKR